VIVNDDQVSSDHTLEGLAPLLSARKNMDVVDAYTRPGSYRAAAEVCGVDPKTVKRKVLAHEGGLLDDVRAQRAPVPKNTDGVRTVVLDLVREANGRGTAKRLLPAARVAGYTGSDRNFRRLVVATVTIQPTRPGPTTLPTPGNTTGTVGARPRVSGAR
jgi:hypothetical protein